MEAKHAPGRLPSLSGGLFYKRRAAVWLEFGHSWPEFSQSLVEVGGALPHEGPLVRAARGLCAAVLGQQQAAGVAARRPQANQSAVLANCSEPNRRLGSRARRPAHSPLRVRPPAPALTACTRAGRSPRPPAETRAARRRRKKRPACRNLVNVDTLRRRLGGPSKSRKAREAAGARGWRGPTPAGGQKDAEQAGGRLFFAAAAGLPSPPGRRSQGEAESHLISVCVCVRRASDWLAAGQSEWSGAR